MTDKQHIFNPNDWHAKFNDFVYGWGYSESHNNLCTYFWKTILAFFFIPFVIVGKGIAYAASKVHVDVPDMSDKIPHVSGKTQKYIGQGVLVLFIAWIGFMCFFIGNEVGFDKLAIAILAIAGVVGGLIGLIYLVICIQERYEEWRYNHPKKERKPNMLISMIKAWKNKNCPMVTWEE